MRVSSIFHPAESCSSVADAVAILRAIRFNLAGRAGVCAVALDMETGAFSLHLCGRGTDANIISAAASHGY